MTTVSTRSNACMPSMAHLVDRGREPMTRVPYTRANLSDAPTPTVEVARSSAPALLLRPLAKARGPHTELLRVLLDVGVVAYRVEPLEHHREVLAPGAHLIDRDLMEVDRASRHLAEDRRHLQPCQLVARDVDVTAIQLGVPLEHGASVLADVAHGDHLQLRFRLHADCQRPLVDIRLEPGSEQVLHEEHWPEDRPRRNAELAQRPFDPPLVLEMRDPRVTMRRGD